VPLPFPSLLRCPGAATLGLPCHGKAPPLCGPGTPKGVLEKGLIGTEKNPVSGTYYHIDIESLKSFRSSFLQDNELHRQSSILGPQLFRDIFGAYSENGLPEDSIQAVAGVPIPASDRVVSLNHNQIDELSEPLSELIEQVEQSNGDPDHPGFRERILGQLKAGRELLRAGVFRAYFLYSILLTTLAELVSRHKGTALSAAAEALIGLLLQNVFSGS
jgi:hypothetical protein